MRRKKNFAGILIIVLVFAMAVINCDNGSTSGNGGTVLKLSDNATLAQAEAKVAELQSKSDISALAIAGLSGIEITLSFYSEATWPTVKESVIPSINVYVEGYNSGALKI